MQPAALLHMAGQAPAHPHSPPRAPALRRWEDIAEAAAEEERREEEGGLPQEEEPDIFELEGGLIAGALTAVALLRPGYSTGLANDRRAGLMASIAAMLCT